jgi:hypothetical protein
VHGFTGYPRNQHVPSVAQILDGLPPANTPPVRVNLLPGTRFRYSGGGTTVVHLLLTDVLGKPFPELMRELVLEPLGMLASTYENPLPERYRARAAAGHHACAQPIDGDWYVYPEMAAAGLWTNAGDLARCALAVQRARAGMPGAFLPKELVDEMLTPVIEASVRPGERIAIGFFISGPESASRFGHGGSDIGFTALLTASIDGDYGAAIMTNGDLWRADLLIDEVMETIADEYAWPDFRPAPRPALPLDAQALARFTGVYELRPGVTLSVDRTVDDGGLTLRVSGQAPQPLVAVSEMRFAAEAVNAEIEFTAARDDTVDGLVLHQDGEETPASRRL